MQGRLGDCLYTSGKDPGMMLTIQRFQTTNNRILDIIGSNKVLENTTSTEELTIQQSVSATWLTRPIPNPGHLSLHPKSSSFPLRLSKT